MIIVDTKTDKEITVSNGLHKFVLRLTPEIVSELAECEKAVGNADTSAKTNYALALRSRIFASIFGF